MSQLSEGWASLTQDERDEMTEKEEEQKILGLVRKYGRSKVDKASSEAKRDRKRRLSNKKITWREIKNRIDNAKGRLKKGEVRTWDKKNNRWVSNKEDVDEAVATAVATSPLWGPKVVGALMTGIGAAGTIYQMKRKKWDELEAPKRGRPRDPNPVEDEYTSKDTIRMRKNREKARKLKNKTNLRKTIEDLYGPIPEHFNWRKELKC